MRFLTYISKSDNELQHKDKNKIASNIASRLGLVRASWWSEAKAYLFTDPISGTSFIAKSQKHAIEKLKNIRVKFGINN